MADDSGHGSGQTASPGELLQAASRGDEGAWRALVERYSTAIAAVTRAHRLDVADAGDVHQTTWLRLIEHWDRIREPNRLGAWLVTTARNECLRVLRHARRQIPIGDELVGMAQSQRFPTSSIEDDVLVAERNAAVKEAVATLPVSHRSLIELLMADPAPSYEEVSSILRMPVGSIGPTRGRCLAKLRTRLEATAGVGGLWPS
ncbi:MAG TPA: sigma-70 family RNA polymerase sigma factor [Candidatus Eisenbacteria bacterium]|nr:sigma-70 family RNA polymerase sigma factor [Candidatus Eisenbacteria bacterium]